MTSALRQVQVSGGSRASIQTRRFTFFILASRVDRIPGHTGSRGGRTHRPAGGSGQGAVFLECRVSRRDCGDRLLTGRRAVQSGHDPASPSGGCMTHHAATAGCVWVARTEFSAFSHFRFGTPRNGSGSLSSLQHSQVVAAGLVLLAENAFRSFPNLPAHDSPSYSRPFAVKLPRSEILWDLLTGTNFNQR